LLLCWKMRRRHRRKSSDLLVADPFGGVGGQQVASVPCTSSCPTGSTQRNTAVICGDLDALPPCREHLRMLVGWSGVASSFSALRAGAVQGDLVPGDFEALRCKFVQIRWAARNIEDLVAATAMEMMVVTMVGTLISGRFTRQVYCLHFACINQNLEVAVNGGNAERGLLSLCQGEDFWW